MLAELLTNFATPQPACHQPGLLQVTQSLFAIPLSIAESVSKDK